MTGRTLITAAEVSARLGHPLGWFYRHRKRLEIDHGFPREVSGCSRRWDPRGIDLWLDQQIPAGLQPNQWSEAAAQRAIDEKRRLRATMIAAGINPCTGEPRRRRRVSRGTNQKPQI